MVSSASHSTLALASPDPQSGCATGSDTYSAVSYFALSFGDFVTARCPPPSRYTTRAQAATRALSKAPRLRLHVRLDVVERIARVTACSRLSRLVSKAVLVKVPPQKPVSDFAVFAARRLAKSHVVSTVGKESVRYLQEWIATDEKKANVPPK